MTPRDLPAFAKLHRDTHRLLAPANAPDPDDVHLAGMFRALEHLPLEVVARAYLAHQRDPERGRFVPRPADLIHAINSAITADGRPSADEAWATALRSRDEAATVVWTDEAARAFAIARPVLEAGDEVGARMAFRQAYDRLVDLARFERRAPAWTASLGTSKELQRLELEAALADGRLPRDPRNLPPGVQDAITGAALARLPGRATFGTLLLELADQAEEEASTCPPDVRERLRAIADDVARRGQVTASRDLEARERTRELQQEAARRVNDAGGPSIADVVEEGEAERLSGRRLLEAVRNGLSFRRKGARA